MLNSVPTLPSNDCHDGKDIQFSNGNTIYQIPKKFSVRSTPGRPVSGRHPAGKRSANSSCANVQPPFKSTNGGIFPETCCEPQVVTNKKINSANSEIDGNFNSYQNNDVGYVATENSQEFSEVEDSIVQLSDQLAQRVSISKLVINYEEAMKDAMLSSTQDDPDINRFSNEKKDSQAESEAGCAYRPGKLTLKVLYQIQSYVRQKQYSDTSIDGWSLDDDIYLSILVEKMGENKWEALSQLLTNRASDECQKRWIVISNVRFKRKGAWSVTEDNRLLQLYNNDDDGVWIKTACLIPGRSPKQCRMRWSCFLSPEINKSAWTVDEDMRLVSAQASFGNKWVKISNIIPGRTENSVKTRFKSIMRASRRMWSPEQDDQVMYFQRRLGSNWDLIAKQFSGRTKNAIRMRYRRLTRMGRYENRIVEGSPSQIFKMLEFLKENQPRIESKPDNIATATEGYDRINNFAIKSEIIDPGLFPIDSNNNEILSGQLTDNFNVAQSKRLEKYAPIDTAISYYRQLSKQGGNGNTDWFPSQSVKNMEVPRQIKPKMKGNVGSSVSVAERVSRIDGFAMKMKKSGSEMICHGSNVDGANSCQPLIRRSNSDQDGKTGSVKQFSVNQQNVFNGVNFESSTALGFPPFERSNNSLQERVSRIPSTNTSPPLGVTSVSSPRMQVNEHFANEYLGSSQLFFEDGTRSYENNENFDLKYDHNSLLPQSANDAAVGKTDWRNGYQDDFYNNFGPSISPEESRMVYKYANLVNDSALHRRSFNINYDLGNPNVVNDGENGTSLEDSNCRIPQCTPDCTDAEVFLSIFENEE